MSEAPRDILTIDQAAELLGVSVKTFNKVLHSEPIPARKIGREWKFSRQALIDWVGSGVSLDFYDRSSTNGHDQPDSTDENGLPERTLNPMPSGRRADGKVTPRRTSGWQIELD